MATQKVSQLLAQAVALHGKGRVAEAAPLYRKALALDPHNALALYNLGLALDAMGEFDAALKAFDSALLIAPSNASLHSSRGASLRMLRRAGEAVAAFRRATALDASLVPAWHNLGHALLDLGQLDDALQTFETTTRLAPHLAPAWFGKGLALRRLGRMAQAVESFDQALALNSGHSTAWSARGESLLRLQRFEEAVTSFDRALALNPREPYVKGLRMSAKLDVCDWRDFEAQTRDLLDSVSRGERACPPFTLLSVTDSGLHQLQAARTWVADRAPENPVLGPFGERRPGKRIRIGYFSMDFRNHALSILAAELFELHDRTAFEVFAFSFKPEPDDSMTHRLQLAFDHFFDVAHLTDVQIAQQARELGIDIAIDLAGLTQNARPGIFAARAAPIQVGYLGYHASMGAPYIDYVVFDDVVAPAQSQAICDETILRLPCFQVNDRKRPVGERVFTRSELGLPEQGFVYCCFNRSAKIRPEVFDLWMRILLQVPGSVLWLLPGHSLAGERLRAAAAARGVEPQRLVFADRLSGSDYIARFRAADLFLDTFPFNAITIASDALWAGLPVLTRMGQSFVSRAAASLLNATGLSQLVANSENEYVEKAVACGLGELDVDALKRMLVNERKSLRLFDSPAFSRNIEKLYAQLAKERLFASVSKQM